MTVKQRGESPEILRLHFLKPLFLRQHFLHEKGIDIDQTDL